MTGLSEEIRIEYVTGFSENSIVHLWTHESVQMVVLGFCRNMSLVIQIHAD